MFLNRCAKVLATVFGLGFLPKAPGSWGSLAGLPLGAGIFYLSTKLFPSEEAVFGELGLGALFLAIFLITLFSIISYFIIHRAEALFNHHDDRRIVIDEVAGQALTVFFLKPALVPYLIGFFLFRLFDVIKPGPAGWADKNLRGAFGVLIDDIFAGIMAITMTMT